MGGEGRGQQGRRGERKGVRKKGGEGGRGISPPNTKTQLRLGGMGDGGEGGEGKGRGKGREGQRERAGNPPRICMLPTPMVHALSFLS
jgi:hypothetical protein